MIRCWRPTIPRLTIMAEVGDPDVSEHLKALDQQAAAFIYGPAGTRTGRHGAAHPGANASVSSWSLERPVADPDPGRLCRATIRSRGSSVTDVIDGLDGNDRLFGLNGDRHARWRVRQRPAERRARRRHVEEAGPATTPTWSTAAATSVIELAERRLRLGAVERELHALGQFGTAAAVRRRA